MKKFIKEKEKLTKRDFVRWNHFSIPLMHKDFVGFSSDSLNVGLSSCIGYRRTQEDTYNCFLDMTFPEVTGQKFSFFSIFDGHGGGLSSDYICKSLLRNIIGMERTRLINIQNQRRFVGGNQKEKTINIFDSDGTLTQAFLKTDEDMRVLSNVDSGGCCAVCLLVVERTDDGNVELICCNVGDSSCVYSRGEGHLKEMLSVTHDLKNRNERKRITEAGGIIQNGRVNQLVNMTRTFGNFQMKNNRKRHPTKQVLIALPEIKRKFVQRRRVEINCDPKITQSKTPNISQDIYNNSHMIVLCCDGLTEKMEFEEIIGESWKMFKSQIDNRYLEEKIERTRKLLEANREEFNLKETRLDQMERKNVASIKGNYIRKGVDFGSVCNDIIDHSILGKGSLDNNTMIICALSPILVPTPIRANEKMGKISRMIAENKNNENFKKVTKRIRRVARNLRKKEFLSKEYGMLQYRNLVNSALISSSQHFENWMEETRRRRMTPHKVDSMTNTEDIMTLTPMRPPSRSSPMSKKEGEEEIEEEEEEEEDGEDGEINVVRTIEFPSPISTPVTTQSIVEVNIGDTLELEEESSSDDDETGNKYIGKKRKRDIEDIWMGSQQEQGDENMIHRLQPPLKKSKIDNVFVHDEKMALPIIRGSEVHHMLQPNPNLPPSPAEISQGGNKGSWCEIM